MRFRKVIIHHLALPKSLIIEVRGLLTCSDYALRLERRYLRHVWRQCKTNYVMKTRRNREHVQIHIGAILENVGFRHLG